MAKQQVLTGVSAEMRISFLPFKTKPSEGQSPDKTDEVSYSGGNFLGVKYSLVNISEWKTQNQAKYIGNLEQTNM